MDNAVYRDYTAMNTEFREGIYYLSEGDRDAALNAFARADICTVREDTYKNKYQSFHGLMLVYASQSKGIEMCRDAVSGECFDGDVFYNLARAELELNNRRLAIAALRRGLDVDDTHPDLIRLRQRLGIRRDVMFRFLSRDNPLNRLWGKITYSKIQQV